MRHGTSSPARVLLSVGLAVTLAPVAATTAFASTTQAKPIAVLGTADNKFDPVDVTATPDAKGEITIELKSEGAPHTWENKDLGIDSGIVNAGATKTFTFKAPPEGKHKIICSLHETQGMIGSLTVAAGGEDADESPTAAPSSQPPASAGASASVGAPDGGDNAPTQGAEEHAEEGEDAHAAPGVAGNKTLARIEAERASEEGAVSGFKFFTMVCIAFLFILGAAILFSTRPRRAAR